MTSVVASSWWLRQEKLVRIYNLLKKTKLFGQKAAKRLQLKCRVWVSLSSSRLRPDWHLVTSVTKALDAIGHCSQDMGCPMNSSLEETLPSVHLCGAVVAPQNCSCEKLSCVKTCPTNHHHHHHHTTVDLIASCGHYVILFTVCCSAHPFCSCYMDTVD